MSLESIDEDDAMMASYHSWYKPKLDKDRRFTQREKLVRAAYIAGYKNALLIRTSHEKSEPQRYQPQGDKGMYPNPEGKWLRYDDMAELFAEKKAIEAELDALHDENEALRKYLNQGYELINDVLHIMEKFFPHHSYKSHTDAVEIKKMIEEWKARWEQPVKDILHAEARTCDHSEGYYLDGGAGTRGSWHCTKCGFYFSERPTASDERKSK